MIARTPATAAIAIVTMAAIPANLATSKGAALVAAFTPSAGLLVALSEMLDNVLIPLASLSAADLSILSEMNLPNLR